MKTRILLIFTMAIGFFTQAQTTGQVAMGAGYANAVYYKMSTGTSNAYLQTSWDLAFDRTSTRSFATRVNDAKNIAVYQVATSFVNWATVDVAVQTSWTRLYNSETAWSKGALDKGTATYGWGEYNMANHHVTGTIIYVLKYANGTYKKFRIDDYFGGYTFTYASWDATAGVWSADTTYTLLNTTNPNSKFNYYSLETNSEVIAEPASADWDFVMTKYNTDYYNDGGSLMYGVTGVLQHPSILVAKNTKASSTAKTAALEYSANVNTIGYDWKTFTGTTYTVNSDKEYYLKNVSGTIYKLVFNSFEGSASGVTTFKYEDVTASLSTTTFDDAVSFGIYPNPAVGKIINLVYELPTAVASSKVSIYNTTGNLVHQANIDAAAGFYNTSLDLGFLASGTYLLQFQSGKNTTVKKIILQ